MKAPSNMVQTDWRHIFWLCERMRPDEIEQLRAFYEVDRPDGSFDPEMAARLLLTKHGPRFTVMDASGCPAAVGGWDMVSDGVWQAWAVGSMEGWDAEWRSITKSCRWVMDSLFKAGARRLEMSAIGTRTHTHEWYQRGLRMTPEGVLRKFGRNGEDIHMFSVLREEW